MGEGCSRKALWKLLLYCPEGYTSGFLLSAFAPGSFLMVGGTRRGEIITYGMQQTQ